MTCHYRVFDKDIKISTKSTSKTIIATNYLFTGTVKKYTGINIKKQKINTRLSEITFFGNKLIQILMKMIGFSELSIVSSNKID
jgi:hypothetical protein